MLTLLFSLSHLPSLTLCLSCLSPQKPLRSFPSTTCQRCGAPSFTYTWPSLSLLNLRQILWLPLLTAHVATLTLSRTVNPGCRTQMRKTPTRRRKPKNNLQACRSAITEQENTSYAPNAPLTWCCVTHTHHQFGGFHDFFARFG